MLIFNLTMMERTKKYILIALFFTLFSCNSFLDIAPDNLATIEMVFNTRSSAEKFLTTCYSYVPDHADPQQNIALVAGDEIWYYAEKDFYMNNETSLRLAKGLQNVTDPYCNFWEGRKGGQNMFIAIRDCNIFLEGLTDVPGLEVNERNRWIAEVKVLKAYFHFWLLQLYGSIPIIDENVSVDAPTEETRIKREPVDDVVNYIVGLLDEAINSEALPEQINFIGAELGRLTEPAAKAIKAKVLMLAASPLFNGNEDYSGYVDADGKELINTTYDPAKWVKAKDACLDAVLSAEQSGHALYSFTDLLPIGEIGDELRQELTIRAAITDRFNEELIWGLGVNWVGALQSWCQPRFTSFHVADINSTKKSHAPTLNVVEDFYTSNGVPIDEDKDWSYDKRYNLVDVTEQIAEDHKYSLQRDYTTVNLHTYREPRFYASVGFDGGKWFSLETTDTNNIPFLNAKNGQTSGKNMQEMYSITGYFTKKLVNYENVITQSSHIVENYSFPIIRLSDVYLMYAEALNEVKGTPDAEVYEYIQKVRNKVGLDVGSDLVTTWQQHSKNPLKPKTKEGMREIIRQERLIELAFEGSRFWDLRRWKLAGDYFSKPIRGWNIYADDTPGFYTVKNIFYRDFLKKDYLWPVSQDELLRNPNLVQSPNW